MAQDTATEARPLERFRKDYRAPDYLVESLELDFELGDDETLVRCRAEYFPRSGGDPTAPLLLDGEDLELRHVLLDGKELTPGEYQLDDQGLRLAVPARSFSLETEVAIRPQDNTRLSGLYRSNDMYCTQCEAEGFRRITFFQDRPDVLSRYRVRVAAPRGEFPVLLSNGNLVEEGDLPGERHFAVYEDPFPKPCYLFALVAGDLGWIEDHFQTCSGRRVRLRVYSEHENVSRLQQAMDSLKHAMRWDEERFGREYDLDIFNIVAVNDFNMGAMENKSLNIFNTAYVLADPETATDDDYDLIEGVVGHEYFHNWTGDRITCRDWFQLTLKEGLTVFRDQSFSADMASAAVKRIQDVRVLRTRQFPEDAGPMAHPIRPESYIAMDNFYTATVYNKGAEVIRMYETLLGREGFRRGMDLYFERHDGQAVSCDDFRAAMADANRVDLEQFERWYLQAGTPVVEARGSWDPERGRYTLTLRQSCPATPGQAEKLPFHIPMRMGLLGSSGADLPLRLEGEEVPQGSTRVLELREAEHRFVFTGVESRPIPSLFRGFSAPIKLRMERSDEDLAFSMAHDSDSFNRWDAGQELARRVILGMAADFAAGRAAALPAVFVEAFRANLLAADGDRSFQAEALRLPGEAALAEEMEPVRPALLHRARNTVARTLAASLEQDFRSLRDRLRAPRYERGPAPAGARRLRNLCLAYLAELRTPAVEQLCLEQFAEADNMSDALAALGCLAQFGSAAADRALSSFHDRWHDNALVLDKWFAVQAEADRPDTLERVQALCEHPDFSLRNPNKVRALLRSFGRNQAHFHREDGQGYRFLADRILALDAINPQMSSRIVAPFVPWKRYEEGLRERMRVELQRMIDHEGLSKNLYEVVHRSLAE